MPHYTPLISTIVVALVLAFIFGVAGAAAAIFAARRLSARRGPHRPVHAGLRRRPGHRERARRDRRDPADVRRRPAFLARRPALGRAHRHPRRRRADRGRDRARHGAGVVARLVDGAGVVFGLALSVASTVVLLRAMQERRLLETERGRIAVGWLIVEDLAMVLALVLLPALAPVAESRCDAELVRARASDRDHSRQGRGFRRHHADRRASA